MEPLAITGIGLVTCLGRGAAASWSALLAGATGLAPPPPGPLCNPLFPQVGLAPGAALRDGDDNGQRARADLVAACDEALAEAGRGASDPSRWGVAIGSSLAAAASSPRFWSGYLADPARADYSSLACYEAEPWLDALAARYDLRGPSAILSNACAAGASALAIASDWLRCGRADRVLVCGSDPVDAFTLSGFAILGALAAGELRPFAADRDGMALSDGHAALVLERRDVARAAGRRELALLAGHGESSDAYHRTQPDPRGRGAALAMRRALDAAGLDASAVDFVSLHATATPANDGAEIAAMREVFGDAKLARLPIHACKPALGHSLGAAGAVEAAISVLAIARGIRPPTRSSAPIDPALGALSIDRFATPARISCAMSNAFGFGGCNASLILVAPDSVGAR